MKFAWRAEMNIDGNILDKDHRAQHDLIRRFVNLPTDDLWRDDAMKFLMELRAVSERHFLHEEMIMDRIRYPQLSEHRAQHKRLIESLDDIIGQMDSAGPGSPFTFGYVKNKSDELLAFWFLDHFVKADLRIKPFLEKAKAMAKA
ncbi:hemerythrin family protein [Azospirillum oleiclasticum]